MITYRGLTWDHPRGRQALERVAAATAGLVRWDVQPLEGFESAPIDELAENYDLIVLDHPHLGDAVANNALQPLDTMIAPDRLVEIEARSIGPSFASYHYDGHLWALPLDAATQVSARLPDRVQSAPTIWAEVRELAAEQPVAISLAGPHALMTFCSLCVALGEEPAINAAEVFVSRPVGAEAFAIMAELTARRPAGTEELNPIRLLERMRDVRDIAYIPLIYGYIGYASGPGAVRFGDAPAMRPGGRRGSTIGGTGVAISHRAEPSQQLLDLLLWLLHPLTQGTLIPDQAGQPSDHGAWTNPALDAMHGGFFSETKATLEESWVRARWAGYPRFQTMASDALRAGLLSGTAAESVLDDLDRHYREGSSG